MEGVVGDEEGGLTITCSVTASGIEGASSGVGDALDSDIAMGVSTTLMVGSEEGGEDPPRSVRMVELRV